jgi:hypothetical protein
MCVRVCVYVCKGLFVCVHVYMCVHVCVWLVSAGTTRAAKKTSPMAKLMVTNKMLASRVQERLSCSAVWHATL